MIILNYIRYSEINIKKYALRYMLQIILIILLKHVKMDITNSKY